MLDGVVVQAVARQQHTDAGLRAIVPRAELIQLRDGLRASSSFRAFSSFGQQVQILGLSGCFWICSVSSVTSSCVRS